MSALTALAIIGLLAVLVLMLFIALDFMITEYRMIRFERSMRTYNNPTRKAHQ